MTCVKLGDDPCAAYDVTRMDVMSISTPAAEDWCGASAVDVGKCDVPAYNVRTYGTCAMSDVYNLHGKSSHILPCDLSS